MRGAPFPGSSTAMVMVHEAGNIVPNRYDGQGHKGDRDG